MLAAPPPPQRRANPIQVHLVAPALMCWGLERLVQSAHPRLELAGAASTLAESLQMMQGSPPDVVVLDVDGDDLHDIVPQLQSQTRANIGIIEVYQFDEASGRDIVKLNPMANWSRDAVWKYIRDHGIPYNPLHDQGYRSIGCWPCTSRAGDGDGERAGRWIGFNKVECGIHTFLAKKA